MRLGNDTIERKARLWDEENGIVVEEGREDEFEGPGTTIGHNDLIGCGPMVLCNGLSGFESSYGGCVAVGRVWIVEGRVDGSEGCRTGWNVLGWIAQL